MTATPGHEEKNAMEKTLAYAGVNVMLELVGVPCSGTSRFMG